MHAYLGDDRNWGLYVEYQEKRRDQIPSTYQNKQSQEHNKIMFYNAFHSTVRP